MPEPHSTSIGIAVGAGIGLTGSVFGAQVDALLVGLVAAILISFWLPTIDDRKKATAAVALSSLLSGYLAPVAAPALSAWLATEHAVVSDGGPLRLLIALLIGIVAPSGLPVVLRWFNRTVEAR